MLELNENDYKYSIQDFSNVYLGARLTYKELAEHDDVPGKIKDAVYRIFLKEVPEDTTLADHFLQLKEGTVSYMAYSQIKASVKVICLVLKPDKKGKIKETYDIRDYSLSDFMKDDEIKNNPDQYMIQEISFKKRNLMMLHV